MTEAKCCLLRLVLKDNVNNHNWRIMIPKVGLLLFSHESSIYYGSSTSTESPDAIMSTLNFFKTLNAKFTCSSTPVSIASLSKAQSQLLASHDRHPLDPFLDPTKRMSKGWLERGRKNLLRPWLASRHDPLLPSIPNFSYVWRMCQNKVGSFTVGGYRSGVYRVVALQWCSSAMVRIMFCSVL